MSIGNQARCIQLFKCHLLLDEYDPEKQNSQWNVFMTSETLLTLTFAVMRANKFPIQLQNSQRVQMCRKKCKDPHFRNHFI